MKYVFLLVPVVLLVYVFYRIWNILPCSSMVKSIITAIGVLVLVMMIVSFIIGFDNKPIVLSTITYEVSTSWLFILLYLLMLFVLADVLRLVHVLPKEFLYSSLKGTLIITGVVFAVFLYGNINYYHKQRKELTITTYKHLDSPRKIVMISDMHLGFHNQRKTLAKWVDMLNKEKADMILIAGDIVDISTYPLFQQKMYEEFHRLNARVFTCLGNHEYISDKEKVLDFFHKANITLLQDSIVEYKDIVIIGRDDRSNPQRRNLKDLIKNIDTSKFSILLDHQPYNLEQAQKGSLNFQFSGHTHYGQVFPVNLVTKAIYEQAYGPLKKQETLYYISSGLGIWGGKFRIATHSEYFVLNIYSHNK